MKFYEKYPELNGADYIYLNPHGVYTVPGLSGVPIDEAKKQEIREDIHPVLRLYYPSLADTGTKNLALPVDQNELIYTGLSWEDHVIACGHPNIFEKERVE